MRLWSGAAASWTLPVFLEKTFLTLDAMAADSLTQVATGKDGTILVVLQMAGGNDGLNMVVPYSDDAYHPRVLLIACSEFGRRVQENANGGTDHGAAAPMFALGGRVKPGLFGKYPSLTNLDDGDLRFHTDSRSVYGTILDQWLHAPSAAVLGRSFPALPIILQIARPATFASGGERE